MSSEQMGIMNGSMPPHLGRNIWATSKLQEDFRLRKRAIREFTQALLIIENYLRQYIDAVNPSVVASLTETEVHPQHSVC
ncbi:unnamed protein product [Clonostachys rhizophaga]|uniref:Uncharacterized protein n=1 Tax=Clonostachys rhizophaga TaxID=160324 RepID=A0A9N9W122_9HYPO|nr:unnamed protein product [Clonostachys rhizophaga]